MSRYEKVDFLMYELQNGFRMALKPFNPPPGGGSLVVVVVVVVGCFLHEVHLTAPHAPHAPQF